MRSISTTKLKRQLLGVLRNNKVIVCFDLFETSGHGHQSRMQDLVKLHNLDVVKWFAYPKATHTICKQARRDYVLIVDSFIIKNIAIKHLSHLYKHIFLIDDGPIRPKCPNVTKINWEPGRNLVKRFHLESDMISDFSLIPIKNDIVVRPNNSTLFAYFSNDNEDLIASILKQLPLADFNEIILIGSNVMNISASSFKKYSYVDRNTFDALFSSAGTIITAGGNTFYCALKKNKNIILYHNDNPYLKWERRTARSRGYKIIHA